MWIMCLDVSCEQFKRKSMIACIYCVVTAHTISSTVIHHPTSYEWILCPHTSNPCMWYPWNVLKICTAWRTHPHNTQYVRLSPTIAIAVSIFTSTLIKTQRCSLLFVVTHVSVIKLNWVYCLWELLNVQLLGLIISQFKVCAHLIGVVMVTTWPSFLCLSGSCYYE